MTKEQDDANRLAHDRDDVDSETKAHHHTIGEHPFQAASGAKLKALKDFVDSFYNTTASYISAILAALTTINGQITVLQADTGWQNVSFAANWSGSLQYRVTGNGNVRLRGSASSSSGTGTTITNTSLPVGPPSARPTQTYNCYVRNGSGLLNVAAAISSAGVIVMGNTNYTNADVLQFDGINYRND